MSKVRLPTPQPNERLKQERLLRGWSQVYIANLLDTDGYTVNRWERGRALPSSYFRQKLCELFGKNAFDLGLLPLPSECAIPASSPLPNTPSISIPWFVPCSRNPCFTGREEILQQLHALFMVSRPTEYTQVVALSGLGGIGKTQIAIEYAYQYASEYTAIFWIKAESTETLLDSIVNIKELSGLPVEQQEVNQHSLLTTLQYWLTTQRRWLLIWDNMENLELLQHLSLPARQGAILITTRCQALGTLAKQLTLGPMERKEGMLFVARRAKVLELEATSEQLHQLAATRPDEYTAAEELVTALGGLPLALDQAGAYIDETGCSITNYLLLYRQQHMRLLDRRGTLKQEHPYSVASTFLLANELVERELRIAADVLRVCALLHAEAIPEELFVQGAMYLELELIAADLSQFDCAIAVLRNLSLIQRHSETQTLSIHPLVQVVLQGKMSEQERSKEVKRVTAALNAVFPEIISDKWEQCERLLPHVLTVATSSIYDQENKELIKILQKATNYLRERGKDKKLLAVLEQQMLRLWETTGPGTGKPVRNGL